MIFHVSFFFGIFLIIIRALVKSMNPNKVFPEGMVPLGKDPFYFSCHTSVDCFMFCCKKLICFSILMTLFA